MAQPFYRCAKLLSVEIPLPNRSKKAELVWLVTSPFRKQVPRNGGGEGRQGKKLKLMDEILVVNVSMASQFAKDISLH